MEAKIIEAKDGSIGFDAESSAERAFSIPDELSLLPIKDTVLFPMVVMPLIVSRESSMKLVDDAVVSDNRIIALATLKDPNVEARGSPTYMKSGSRRRYTPCSACPSTSG